MNCATKPVGGRCSRRRPSLPETSVHRQPFVDFHEKVQVGKTNDLVVRLEDVEAETVDVEQLIELALSLDRLRAETGKLIRLAIEREQEAQRIRNAQYPLAHRPLGKHLIDQ